MTFFDAPSNASANTYSLLQFQTVQLVVNQNGTTVISNNGLPVIAGVQWKPNGKEAWQKIMVDILLKSNRVPNDYYVVFSVTGVFIFVAFIILVIILARSRFRVVART